jgi:hypothetical protein
MKKLLFVLLIVALASYLFVGCTPVTPSEGEGEGEDETEVTVVIDDVVKVGNYTYVVAGSHDITVTFPAPVVELLSANISPCSGDYTKAFTIDAPVLLSPDATRKIWTGSGTFTPTGAELCCASYVEVSAGLLGIVVAFPVIVDGCPPYAEIKVSVADCTYAGCALNFASTSEYPWAGSELCCGDDCSGSASWTINLYEGNPFEASCDPTDFEEPIASDSGVCPIDFTTECLDAGTYYAVISLVDNVGLEQNYYAKIEISGGETDTDCSIVVMEGFEAAAPVCVTWTEAGDTIGTCEAICMD